MEDATSSAKELENLSQNNSRPMTAPSTKEEGKKLVEKSPYPKSVFFIIGNEFCERFCFFGMRAILVFYFMDHLSWSEGSSTGVYHAFIVGCAITPLLGAFLADGYIGRFKTILYLSIVYSLGCTLMSFTAFPPPFWLGPAIGLLLIAFGTGGIKPCVSAFGGDQFRTDQKKERTNFFSIFYFSINLGAFFSIIITPLIKDGVTCFGAKCYPLAFAVPAMLMILSTALFVVGRRWYIVNPPPGSIISNFFKCIGSAISNKCRSTSRHKQHWLDYAGPQFETTFVEDVKRVLRVFTLCTPVPVFWALFDQQGSRWTLQAAQLDRRMSDDWYLLSEQIQAINPILILLFIPLFDVVIYPLLDKLKIPNRPLQRMVMGMLLASLSFVASGILQLQIESKLPYLESNHSFVTVFNEGPCDLKVGGSFPATDLPALSRSAVVSISSAKYNFQLEKSSNSCVLEHPKDFVTTFYHPDCYLIVLSVGSFKSEAGRGPVPLLRADAFPYNLTKEATGDSYVRLILVGPHSDNMTLAILKGSKRSYYYPMKDFAQNPYMQVGPGRYRVVIQEFGENVYELAEVLIGGGGKYTLLVNNYFGNVTHYLITDVTPNSVSVWWQLPQYIIITLGEIALSVTGISFSYSQAPSSMKSVVQAAWFLTIGFGNIIDVVIASSNVIPNQTIEFFFFAIFMFVTTLIFALLASCYQYVDSNSSYEDLDEGSSGSSGSERVQSEDGIVLKESQSSISDGEDGRKKPLKNKNTHLSDARENSDVIMSH